MARTFKQMLATDELIPVFSLARMAHPVIIDMFGLAGGYCGFWMDQEHAGATVEEVRTASLAAKANDFDFFVRMPPVGYWQVTQALEAGAGGVMAAQIHSAEQAAQFVSWAKFSPQGTRGMNASGRDANYTHKTLAQFAEDANREQFVAIQIETVGSVEEADAIAALEGVDLLFVGPADLSLALGVPGEFHHEKLWTAIERVSEACQKHGKTWGAVVPNPEFADRAVEKGCRMPTMGSDILSIRRGIAALQDAFGNHFKTK